MLIGTSHPSFAKMSKIWKASYLVAIKCIESLQNCISNVSARPRHYVQFVFLQKKEEDCQILSQLSLLLPLSPPVPYLHQGHSHFLMALFCQSVSKVGNHHSTVSRISITWLIKLGGVGETKWTRGIRSLIYKGVQVETGAKIGWNWSLIYIHPFNIHTPLSPTVNSVTKTQLFLGRKNYWRGLCPPSQVMPVVVIGVCIESFWGWFT